MADNSSFFGDDDSPSWLTASRETEPSIISDGYGLRRLLVLDGPPSAECATEVAGVQWGVAKSSFQRRLTYG
ncbi:hypothetical protein R1flu_018582 [Riccia fluitans]|uniref:Uncharacterized protein n=1 Tax=Riccia fluitans TaxID=41844 RepID=A0ABD1ZJS1_9MARC